MADVFTIDTLRSRIDDFAKGNRYQVTFSDLPQGLSTAVNENLQYLCEAVSLPTKGIASNAQDIYGPPREIPYRETFTEAALSFILDDKFTVKRFFDRWQRNIINVKTGNVNYWNNFVSTINITRLSNDATDFQTATDIYKIEVREADPSADCEIALGHAMGGEILKLSVTFKYRKWMLLN